MDSVAEKVNADPTLRFLAPGGEMRRRIREFDWSSTDLGDPHTWSSSLKTAVSIMLDFAGPAYIAVGPRFVQLYNDAYIPIFGKLKHPHAVGLTTPESWAEIWDSVGPLFERVLSSGQAVSMENHLFIMLRNGYLEESYFTFTYSPLTDEVGHVYGVFATGWETTSEVITGRRAGTMHMLVQALANAEDILGVRAAFEKTVLDNPMDIPFGLWYEVGQDRHGLNLVHAAGIAAGSKFSPAFLDPANSEPYAGLMDINRPKVEIRYFGEQLQRWIRPHPHQATPGTVIIEPLCYSSSQRADAFLVLGVNPMRPLDTTQEAFFDQIRLQLQNAVQRVSSYEMERQEYEHRFATIMSVLPCLVWMSNSANECIFVNETWLRLRGRTLEQEIGCGWMEGIHPDDLEMLKRARAEWDRNMPSTLEYRLRDSHGRYRWILNDVTPRYGMSGEFLGYTGTCLDITERKNIEQEVLASQAELRMLYDRLQYVREEERRALAREVHDQLGQILSAVKIDITLLEEECLRSERPLSRRKLVSELRSVRRMMDRSIQVVRHLATELRPPELESQGLAAAIEWHARDFERRTKIRCTLELPDNNWELGDALALTLFRIFQEAMTNVLRHAKASQVYVRLEHGDRRIRVRVLDNGIGISRARAHSPRSIGLKGMRERAALAGGRLVVGSLPTSGTLVSVTVPLEADGCSHLPAPGFGFYTGKTA